MPPRKKLKSSSSSSSSTAAAASSSSSSVRKSNSNQNSQPSKFGIQHFFLRHTQNSPLPSSPPPAKQQQLPQTSSLPNPITAPTSAPPLFPNPNVNASTSPPPTHPSNPTSPPLPNPPLNLLPVDLDAADNNPIDVSPDVPKSVSLEQRINFSPAMLIKQSQDDGGEEVTWKISPVNERLQAFSKHMLHLLKPLPHSSNPNTFAVRPCSLNTSLSDTAIIIDKRLSSLTPMATLRSSAPGNRVGLKWADPVHDSPINGSITDVNSSLATRRSPFRTPPSLSYCHERLANDAECNTGSDQLCFGQHKKALLELLDQVEDAISVEDSTASDINECSSTVQERKGNKMPIVKADFPGKAASTDSPEKVTGFSSSYSFLVLEVSEKQMPANSSVVKSEYKVLRLLNEQSGEERAVYLWQEWFHSVVAPGDTVNVIGEFDDQGKCDVDHDNNLLIVHPDILVSGTRVAASFSCARRAVLDERLKCSEHSIAALIGTLLHQIFQVGLIKEKPTINFLEECAKMVLQKNLESLYACQAIENDILKILFESIPKILNWINLYKDSQDSKAPFVDFGSDESKKLRIPEVIDIEEMAWAPKYGLKGMIDASIRVKVKSHENEAKETIVPLEFKTGKLPNGQSSMEHRAQVILYCLLMSERYLKDIDFGLLYYLQSGQTQGIMLRRSDVVGILMRRNDLANDILKASSLQQLPPMLQSPSMCMGCRHLDVCAIYHKVYGGCKASSGLGDLFDSHVHHLTTAHCLFLRHWDQLIDLEAKEKQLVKNDIWHFHGSKSDRFSGCLSSVVLDPVAELPHEKSLKDNCFIYHFVHQKFPSHSVCASDGDSLGCSSYPMNDMDFALKIGDFVILRNESGRQVIASGVITDISHVRVSVSFSKCLRLPGSDSSSEANDLLRVVWQINKDEVMTPFSVMRFNLVQLFLQSDRSSHLRKLIVDLEAPRFDSGCIFSQDPAISYILSEKSLNSDQRRAIFKILTAKDYALILGMPGTGKTSTMVHAVKALLIRGASILLTSYTNSAVDNLLIKLKSQGIDFLRIGRHEAVHPEVRANCFSEMDIHSVEDIRLRLDQVKVVAVTCLGITSPLLSNRKFDVCIVDEAGQITLPISLGPLMLASLFVLVGDHYQLPPLVQSIEAREKGMAISLFCRLSEAHPQAISALQSQYRMCQGIMELSNALIYGDRLRCGSSEIASAKLKLSSFKSCSLWLKEVLDPKKPVIFINTDMLPAFEAKDSKTLNNPTEAYIIAEVVKELINSGIESADIGIITPYNSQANLIRTAVGVTSVEIHTIDKYQGRDKDCMLVSFVRSIENPRGCNSSLLGDWHRINVALTRAKKKLIMVGSCNTLSKIPLLKLLVEKIDAQFGILKVSNEDISHEDLKGNLKKCSHTK